MVAAAAWAALAAACGSGPAPIRNHIGAAPTDCGAIPPSTSTKPVEVTLWSYNPSLAELAAEFNRAQTGVRVKVQAKGNAEKMARAYLLAATGGKGLPDLVQLPGFATAPAVDTGSVVAAQVCIDATGYDLGDFLPQTLATTKVAGTQWAMPGALDDAEVFLFDQKAFARAGLDPAQPPATVAELLEAARALATAGIARPMGPLWFTDELMLSTPMTDGGEGHDGRPTRATFDTDAARRIYRANAQIIEEGLAAPIPRTPQGDLDAIAAGRAAMTIHPIADLRSVAASQARPQIGGSSLAVGPVPTATGPGGVLIRSNSLFISRSSTVATRGAAWSFLTWLHAPKQQAAGMVSSKSFFFPTRRSAATDPMVVEVFTKQPLLAAAWGLFSNAPAVPVPAIGPHSHLIGALDSVLKSTSADAASLDEALSTAARSVDAELATYNADPVRYVACASLPSSAGRDVSSCR